jgi:hypothetical protein
MLSTKERQAILDAVAVAAQLQASVRSVGGTTWIVQRPTGDGMTAPVSLTPSSAVSGYVYRRRIKLDAASRSGSSVTEAEWWFVGTAEQNLLAGDLITSSSEATRRFRVQTVAAHAGYLRARLEVR